jgi:hypothetical protein
VPKLLAWLAALFELALTVLPADRSFLRRSRVAGGGLRRFPRFCVPRSRRIGAEARRSSAFSSITSHSWQAFCLRRRMDRVRRLALSLRFLRTPNESVNRPDSDRIRECSS